MRVVFGVNLCPIHLQGDKKNKKLLVSKQKKLNTAHRWFARFHSKTKEYEETHNVQGEVQGEVQAHAQQDDEVQAEPEFQEEGDAADQSAAQV